MAAVAQDACPLITLKFSCQGWRGKLLVQNLQQQKEIQRDSRKSRFIYRSFEARSQSLSFDLCRILSPVNVEGEPLLVDVLLVVVVQKAHQEKLVGIVDQTQLQRRLGNTPGT